MTLTWDFQTIESFDAIADASSAHAALQAIRGPVPPFADTGDAKWSFGGGGYTLNSPGLYGIGQSISRPNSCTFTFEKATAHPGVRLRFAFTVAGFTGTRVLCKIGSLQIEVTSGGLLQRSNAAAGGTVTSSGSALSTATVHVFEIAFYSSTTAGAYRIHLNGVEDASLSADTIDTKGASANPSSIVFNETNATFDLHIDNVRIDASDSALSGAFDAGDMMTSPSVLPRMQTLWPTSQGNYTDFHTCGDHSTADPFCLVTSAGSSNNYTFVNETQCDEKKSFLQSGTDGQRDSWMMGGLSSEVGTIYMVQTNHSTWGDADGRRDFYFLRNGGSNYDHANNADFEIIGAGAQLGWSCRAWPIRPWDSAAFTPPDFPLEVGQKVAGTGAPLGVTQAIVILDYLAVVPPGTNDMIWTLPILGVGW